MPRGFLIKRKKHDPCSWKRLMSSEEERSESGSASDPEAFSTTMDIKRNDRLGSPDSGYSKSPTSSSDYDTAMDHSIYRKHFAKEWLQRNNESVKDLDLDRPSSVESSSVASSDLESKESEILIVDDNSTEDQNGNNVRKSNDDNNDQSLYQNLGEKRLPSYAESIFQRDYYHDSQQGKSVLHEFNNNINNNREALAAFNRNMAMSRYPNIYSHNSGMPISLPPSPVNSNLSVNTSVYGSPMYWSAFNRLTLASPLTDQSPVLSPASSASGSIASIRSPIGAVVNYNKLSDQQQVQNFLPRSKLQQISPPKGIASPSKRKANPSNHGENHKSGKSYKRPKSARKISFEEEFKSSPVSGTYIKDDTTVSTNEDGIRVVSGDIDSSMNLVEITPEAEAELAKIENKIGDFICRLCKEYYENAFSLAQHRCSRIMHVEYRCPECDKVFNCPANLASHRRWHKPRVNGAGKSNGKSNNSKIDGTASKAPANEKSVISEEDAAATTAASGLIPCEHCGKKFKRQAYLKKHIATHFVEQAQQQHKQSPSSWLASPPMPALTTPITDRNMGEPKAENRISQDELTRNFLPPHILNEQSSIHLEQKHHFKHQQLDVLKDTVFNCSMCNSRFDDTIALDKHRQMCCSMIPITGRSPVAVSANNNNSGSLDMFTCKYCHVGTFFNLYDLGRHIYECHPSQSRQAMMLQLPPLSRPC